MATVEETCNFVDDDGDGATDEGFRYQAGGWVNLARTARFASATGSVVLDDGSIAVSWLDHFSEVGDRLGVMRVTSDGETIAGPSFVALLGPSAGLVGPILRDGTLTWVAGSNDWKSCTIGCPILFARFEVAGMGLIEAKELAWPSVLGNSLLWQAGSRSRGASVARAKQRTTDSPCLVWFDAGSGEFLRDLVSDAAEIAFAASDGALAMQERILSTGAEASSRLRLRLLSADGSADIAVPLELGPAVGTLGPMAWNGDELVLLQLVPEESGWIPQLRRFSSTGGNLGESAPLPKNLRPESILAMQAGVLVLGAIAPDEHQLWRFDATLRPVPAAQNPIHAHANYAVELVARPAPALVRSTYDGRTVDLAGIGCP
jgi:hypothetical protein